MGDTIDDHDWMDDREDETPDEVVCKRCGAKGLTWYDIGTAKFPQFRLFENKGLRLVPHVCPPKDHSDAFEDEP